MSNNFFIDRFEADRPNGKVIGSQAAAGISRKGIDSEGVIGIDNNALRFQPMLVNGWAKCGIAYGPYQRQNGLVMAISLSNGHNTAQADSLNQPFKRRMLDWVRGDHTLPPHKRMLKWLLFGRKRRTLRMWRRWWETHKQFTNGRYGTFDENIALGWFSEEVPEDPRREGNTFIVHATGTENGELWARIDENTPPLIRGLQNVPLYYIVILREQGAAYYAAAVPETAYLPAYPQMRPLGIDTHSRDETVYAGLYQSVMGQSGFWADSRIREIQVDKVQGLDSWYGTAAAADGLNGEGLLADFPAETGQAWQALRGRFQRTAQGSSCTEQDNLAVLDVPSPAGLIHMLVHTAEEIPQSVSLIWRFQDLSNYWEWETGQGGSQLAYILNGKRTVVATDDQVSLTARSTHSLQLLDDGRAVRLLVDGKPVCGTVNRAEPLPEAVGAGIASCGPHGGVHFSALEVHPRQIPVPEALDFRPLWKHADERHVVVRDDFCGPAGDIDGRTTLVGGQKWRRELGIGVIELTGECAARVKASGSQPNPGRTIYTIPWDNPDFVDLELDFVPPGSGPSAEEKCRIGLAIIQDEANYITISTYLDLHYGGSSFAFFYHLGGYEDLYDAVWSNVGRTIDWGVPARGRVIMDGVNMAILLNGEAILYRSLTDVFPDIHSFSIRRVGIVVNWEWGDDTGTVMNEFIAADKA